MGRSLICKGSQIFINLKNTERQLISLALESLDCTFYSFIFMCFVHSAVFKICHLKETVASSLVCFPVRKVNFEIFFNYVYFLTMHLNQLILYKWQGPSVLSFSMFCFDF